MIGLEAKNAILMVEFAIEQRHAGKSIEEAAVEAGRERIRPILMTSFAFILGVVPLVIATGAGASARHSLGIGVFFGMVVSTLLGVNIIPNLFIFVRKISERMAARVHHAPVLTTGPAAWHLHQPETTDVMKRSLFAPAAVLGAVLLAAGCAIGPGYHRPDVAPPAAYRAPSAGADSLDSTYAALAASRDSMASRKHDTSEAQSAAEVHPLARPSFQLADTAANLSWFDLFQDTVLKQLVITAINNNRDVRIAAATVEEYHADLGFATANLFPSFTITGQSGRQKQNFGNIALPGPGGTTTTFTVPAQNYLEALGNVSWELDFWGRLRNTRTEARSNLLAQEDSRRFVVLTLVGNVVTAYLGLRQLDLDLEIAEEHTRLPTGDVSAVADRSSTGAPLRSSIFASSRAMSATPRRRWPHYEKQVAQQENQLSLLLGRSVRSRFRAAGRSTRC